MKIIKEMKNMKEKMKENFMKVIGLIMGLVFLVPTYVFATPNYGQNFGQWTLDQLFWVAVALFAIPLIGNAVKKNIIGIVITLIVAAVVLGVMKDPTGLQSVGINLWGVIKGQ